VSLDVHHLDYAHQRLALAITEAYHAPVLYISIASLRGLGILLSELYKYDTVGKRGVSLCRGLSYSGLYTFAISGF